MNFIKLVNIGNLVWIIASLGISVTIQAVYNLKLPFIPILFALLTVSVNLIIIILKIQRLPWFNNSYSISRAYNKWWREFSIHIQHAAREGDKKAISIIGYLINMIIASIISIILFFFIL